MGAGSGAGAPRWLHRLALATAGATLVLIFAGGVVTDTGSGLAVPDWPTTFGRNMFLYPPSEWAGGVLYEHSHRLLGSLVGLLTVALAAVLWWAGPPGWPRRLGLAAVALVVAQGVLGGLRVVLVDRGLALVHGVAAQAFFALVVGLAVRTAPRWAAPPAPPAGAERDGLGRLGAMAVGLISLQLALGAVLTHTGVWLHAHLVGAALAAGQTLWVASRALGRHAGCGWIARPARLLAGLVTVQLFLGAGAFLVRFTALGARAAPALAVAFPVVHRVVGSLVLGAAVALALRAWRLEGVARGAAAPADPEPEAMAGAGPVSGRAAA